MSKYNVGDRVRISAARPDHYYLSVGLTGTVKFVHDCGTPLVAFDGWERGHYGDSGYKSPITNCWNIWDDEGVTLEMVTKPKRKGTRKAGGRCDQVLSFLLAGKSLTQGEAIVLGFGTRLAATVHTLKGRGHTIITTMKEDNFGHPYAEYSLVKRAASGKRKAA